MADRPSRRSTMTDTPVTSRTRSPMATWIVQPQEGAATEPPPAVAHRRPRPARHDRLRVSDRDAAVPHGALDECVEVAAAHAGEAATAWRYMGPPDPVARRFDIENTAPRHLSRRFLGRNRSSSRRSCRRPCQARGPGASCSRPAVPAGPGARRGTPAGLLRFPSTIRPQRARIVTGQSGVLLLPAPRSRWRLAQADHYHPDPGARPGGGEAERPWLLPDVAAVRELSDRRERLQALEQGRHRGEGRLDRRRVLQPVVGGEGALLRGVER